ncbi:MAG TPA: hypothetical protein DCM05_12340 [Elusimicrobia bacterium]|nr:hypothetical protein [Elusimicrobiota bacterium]
MKRHKPAPEAFELEKGIHWVLWIFLFVSLAVVPDQKILRYKMLFVEAGVWALLAAAAVSWLARADARLTRTALDAPVALYALGGLLFYLLSPERAVSRLELNRILFSAAAFFAAAWSWPKLRSTRAALALFVWPAAALAFYSLLQLKGGVGPLDVPKLDRPIATFGNPIFLAAYFAAALPPALALAFADDLKAPRKLYAIPASLLLAGLWAAQSRAAFAGLAFAALPAALLFLRGKTRWAALAGWAAALGLALWHFKGRQWTHGLIWKDSLSLWLAHPWLGCGLGRFHVEFPAFASEALKSLWPQQKVIINFAHNEYLQVLAETGVAGLALFLAVPLLAVRWAFLRLREAPLLAGPFLSAAALFAMAFFSPDLRFGVSSFIAFAFLGVCASCAGGSERPFPPFPGRASLALLLGAFLSVWGSLAAQPILAQRRLAAEPAFHTQRSPETQKLLDDMEAKLKAAPEDGDLAENLAYLYAKEKEWGKATELFELAARLLPGRPGPLNNLGNIHYSLGRREEALAYWQRSLKAAPGQVDAHLNLGKTLYEMGRLKESAEHLQAALRRDPKNEKAQILLKKMIE